MKLLYVLNISLLFVLGSGQVNANAQDKMEIRNLIESVYASNVKAGNGKRYSNIYTDDALWMPPKAQDRHGQTDIEAGFRDMVKAINIEATLTAEDIQLITNNFAYVVGKARVLVRSKEGTDPKNINLRMMWIMNKHSGKWKIARQIWNQKP